MQYGLLTETDYDMFVYSAGQDGKQLWTAEFSLPHLFSSPEPKAHG